MDTMLQIKQARKKIIIGTSCKQEVFLIKQWPEGHRFFCFYVKAKTPE
jgi:hypothetical protein